MNLEHLKALAASSDDIMSQSWATLDGKRLWTDGFICTAADFPAQREMPQIASKWSKWQTPEGREISGGELLLDAKCSSTLVVRHIEGLHINEAYWRTFSGGCVVMATTELAPVRFYRDGLLEAVVMGINPTKTSLKPIDSATDEEVFRVFACEANDWYLQSIDELKRRLREAA